MVVLGGLKFLMSEVPLWCTTRSRLPHPYDSLLDRAGRATLSRLSSASFYLAFYLDLAAFYLV